MLLSTSDCDFHFILEGNLVLFSNDNKGFELNMGNQTLTLTKEEILEMLKIIEKEED